MCIPNFGDFGTFIAAFVALAIALFIHLIWYAYGRNHQSDIPQAELAKRRMLYITITFVVMFIGGIVLNTCNEAQWKAVILLLGGLALWEIVFIAVTPVEESVKKKKNG
ncbi:MAG: hypothetical protein OXT68_05185 [Chloroflexota bacterium]|nr:hypothetical protein [Chloroflexota bacterium]